MNKKIKLTMVTIISVIAIIFIFTTKIGTVVNQNYVEFNDGTGYYYDEPIEGNYKIYPFLKITDMFSNEI